MRWRRGAGADQVQDRRGMRMGGVPAIGGGMGIVGVLLFLVLNVLGGGGGSGGIGLPDLAPVQGPTGTAGTIPPDDDEAQFVGFVIDDVQDTWTQIFRDAGRTYERTEVVLFSEATQTGCGVGQSATGPFYCPRDRLVYIDLTFFNELQTRFGAPGDFAEAYVIAHEVGHHVQTLLGISEQVQSREDGIKLELQADCFAGVWGNAAAAEGLLERGDLEEGLGAAAAVGDDRIQEQTQGRVNPETWTHGSSEQRMQWFRTGFDSGDPEQCDTFD
jgi:predicted metalloprotease